MYAKTKKNEYIPLSRQHSTFPPTFLKRPGGKFPTVASSHTTPNTTQAMCDFSHKIPVQPSASNTRATIPPNDSPSASSQSLAGVGINNEEVDTEESPEIRNDSSGNVGSASISTAESKENWFQNIHRSVLDQVAASQIPTQEKANIFLSTNIWSNTFKILVCLLIIRLSQFRRFTFDEVMFYNSPEGSFWKKKRIQGNIIFFALMRALVKAYLQYRAWAFACACVRVGRAAGQKMNELPSEVVANYEWGIKLRELSSVVLYHLNVVYLRTRPFDEALAKIIYMEPIEDLNLKLGMKSEAIHLIENDIGFAVNVGHTPEPYPYRFLSEEQCQAIREEYTKYLVEAKKKLVQYIRGKKVRFVVETRTWYEDYTLNKSAWKHCLETAAREEWPAHPILVYFYAFLAHFMVRNYQLSM
ncbi:hypothetical protein JCM33374_g6492 [Metschnikowia sp. JCM 33374]|nr:hypothetical protein JCM33374_g6492 [Metschnikowia sp. JCM 33374]